MIGLDYVRVHPMLTVLPAGIAGECAIDLKAPSQNEDVEAVHEETVSPKFTAPVMIDFSSAQASSAFIDRTVAMMANGSLARKAPRMRSKIIVSSICYLVVITSI